MVTQPFRFPGSAGKTLSGRMELPGGRVRGWAIFAHCFTCGKDNRAAVRIARLLAREGIGVLRFDFAGLGESEGDFADIAFHSTCTICRRPRGRSRTTARHRRC